MTRPTRSVSDFRNSLSDLEQEMVAITPPGQPQNEESVERDRRFAARVTEMEKLKALRLQQPKEPGRGRRRRRAAVVKELG